MSAILLGGNSCYTSHNGINNDSSQCSSKEPSRTSSLDDPVGDELMTSNTTKCLQTIKEKHCGDLIENSANDLRNIDGGTATGGDEDYCGNCGGCRTQTTGHNNNNNNNDPCDSIETIPFNNRLSCNNSSSSSAINKCCQSRVNSSSGNANRTAGGYLIAVHRKLSRQDTYFLSYHKSRPSLFGVPLLIPCYEGGTNKDLYCAVWVQVARLLSPLPSTPPDQSNHATDW